MDNQRFDALTRSLALGMSRRQVLIRALGLGGAAAATLDTADAARRPTPIPKPVTCPGEQTPCASGCCCPAGSSTCGPDCCPDGQAVCCDNACCYGQCYGEELCCPSGSALCTDASGATICLPAGQCCTAIDCPNGRCDNGVCVPNPPSTFVDLSFRRVAVGGEPHCSPLTTVSGFAPDTELSIVYRLRTPEAGERVYYTGLLTTNASGSGSDAALIPFELGTDAQIEVSVDSVSTGWKTVSC